MLTRQVKLQIEKLTLTTITKKVELPNLMGNELLFIHSSPDRPHFSILRRKVYGFYPLQMDIKRLIPAPTQFLEVRTKSSEKFP